MPYVFITLKASTMVTPAKKFINNPNDVVTEFIEGLVETYPGLQYLDGLPEVKVVLRADVSAANYDKVAVISGGGSGHEPAQAGYVGEGMLTAAICGDVFASPPVDSILAGIRAVTGPKGCLLVVTNYTGDRLNFGLAAEQAKTEGFEVETVIVGDDCALPPPRGIAGRRGLAGTILVHKVAGAAAAAGLSLAEVAAEAKRASEMVGTMGVALSVCSLPGQDASDRLGPEKMELGLGVHGEPGAAVVDIQPVDVVVSHVLQQILIPETNYVPITRGNSVVLMVNGLGGTPLMELMIAAGKAVAKLQLEYGLAVDRVYTGSFMTSLDMAGFSISIMKADQSILERLDAPTKAPGWPVGTDAAHQQRSPFHCLPSDQNKTKRRRSSCRRRKRLCCGTSTAVRFPNGYDLRLVGRRIESALKNSGYSGPLTITAIGDLSQTPGDKALRELSFTGIALEHSHPDLGWPFVMWSLRNPSPATIMLISGPGQLESLATTLHSLHKKGYTILLACPQRAQKSYLLGVSKEWLWKSILEGGAADDNKQETTTRLVLPDLCTETEESPWQCSVCLFAAQSCEDLTTHLKSVIHAYNEWARVASHKGEWECLYNLDVSHSLDWQLLCKADVSKSLESKATRIWIARTLVDAKTLKEKCRKDMHNKYKMKKNNEVTQYKKENNEVTQYKKKNNKKENNEVTQYTKKNNEVTQYKEQKTLVLWHINSCPIPDGYLCCTETGTCTRNGDDTGRETTTSRLVRPRIESALKNSGSLTITAIGNLTQTPRDKVLRELYSTGIALTHAHDVEADLHEWTHVNPYPATIMLISGICQLECLAPLLHDLILKGYRILLAYPQRYPAPRWLWKCFLLLGVKEEWLWKRLLEESADKRIRLDPAGAVFDFAFGQTSRSSFVVGYDWLLVSRRLVLQRVGIRGLV
ncbi:unnamed protein product [Thlaspi arvense]|uniref:DhaK domain-containing protein n=2 Tax=Magnoliopsida TaxID=3398 RepID=A0AAU9R8L1_THLAR|nr:unnamed protein product [Thlaspi arvense]